MLQTYLTNNLCRCLGGDSTYLVEERYTTHAHGSSHILQANLTTAHVLQHKLLDIAHQLLIHDVVH